MSISVTTDLDAECDNCGGSMFELDKAYCSSCFKKEMPGVGASDIYDKLFWLARDMQLAGVDRHFVQQVERLVERPVKVGKE